MAQQCDADFLEDYKPSEKIGELIAEKVVITLLASELTRANTELATTQTATEVMGRAHKLLEQLFEGANTEERRKKRCTRSHKFPDPV